MKQLALNNNKIVLVDDEDFYLLKTRHWFINKQGYLASSDGHRRGGKAFHRFILKVPWIKMVDHINRDKLDNRKENLRLCTPGQNRANTPLDKNNTSGYRGVSYSKKSKKWLVQCGITYGGIYATKEEAALAYNKIAKKKYGKFAYINIVKRQTAT